MYRLPFSKKTVPFAIPTNEWFAYVLYADGDNYVLFLGEYDMENELYSKHGVLAPTPNNVICAGLMLRPRDDVLYMDNLSGTFRPDKKRLQHCAEEVAIATGMRVVWFTWKKLNDNKDLIGTPGSLIAQHPDVEWIQMGQW